MSPEPITIEVRKPRTGSKLAHTPFKRKSVGKVPKAPVKKRVKAKKKKKASVWDEFGIKRPQYVRYSGYGGVLWWLMSQYIRKSEFEQYGVCIDGCGIPITDWRDCDLGHLKSASKLATRFTRENLGLQRKWCNSPWGGDGNSVGFAQTVDKRYGEGTALRLEKQSQQKQTAFSKEWYREQIAQYKALMDTSLIDNSS